MAFTDSQVRQLKAKLDRDDMSRRAAPMAPIFSYVEEWHAIAEANRIFGFDAWDRRTVLTALRVERVKAGRFTQPPTPPRCGSACALATLRYCARGLRNGRR